MVECLLYEILRLITSQMGNSEMTEEIHTLLAFYDILVSCMLIFIDHSASNN